MSFPIKTYLCGEADGYDDFVSLTHDCELTSSPNVVVCRDCCKLFRFSTTCVGFKFTPTLGYSKEMPMIEICVDNGEAVVVCVMAYASDGIRPEIVSKGVPKGVSEGLPKGVSEGVPKGVSKGIPKGGGKGGGKSGGNSGGKGYGNHGKRLHKRIAKAYALASASASASASDSGKPP